MNIKSEFTEPERDRLRDLCNFTPEEREVFELRTSGRSLVEISMTLCISEATVSRRLKAVKRKIVKVI